MNPAPSVLPQTGQIVRVRSRQYLVQQVIPGPNKGDQTLVRLNCVEDDSQGEPLEVLWECEIDAAIREATSWEDVAKRGFDPTRTFAAYLNTLRWNCVTATDPKLFQAPYRAGIEVMAYQLEPLRKALQMPRVNLFIADDVGLGKTIEAGLIVRELLMRQKIRTVVVACPPSVLLQWREELEQRFGLSFAIYDRAYVAEKRRELGYSFNPWNTHSRFLISHALLRDETYAAPLRDWLGPFLQGSLLILDEAHNAAPASGARYAIDSQFTRVVREIAQRFEHRLFLSATPHNGHSNSFSSLLEILDPQRFCRGVAVVPRQRDEVMVRRLKSDLRKISGGFPERKAVAIEISGLADSAPELELSRLLDEYRILREQRLQTATRSAQTAAALVTTSLQKRLLSSIEAFARTLRVHRRGLEAKAAKEVPSASLLEILNETPGSDDERADLPEDEAQRDEDAAMEVASRDGGLAAKERKILDRMTEIADSNYSSADPRIQHLIKWVGDNLRTGGSWNERRVLIFTEYTDTKRYLVQQLESAFPAERIGVFHGGMGEEARENVKQAFNADPAKHPLRILIATDAAREGVNLQNYCADLFHFDLPWNPGRMEQRNGRVDRKLQRSPEVRCHYFVFTQRPEDRVLQVLPQKTEKIVRELGSMSPVLSRRIEHALSAGITHKNAGSLAKAIEKEELPGRQAVEEELEAVRAEKQLVQQLESLRKLLDQSRKHLAFDEAAFRDALSCSLQMVGAGSLKGGPKRWELPPVEKFRDRSWMETLDTLRVSRNKDQPPWEWRRTAPLRPVVFQDPGSLSGDTVHLHLEQRVVQRLLGRFRAQGFVHDDLSRACIGQSKDAVPRVMLLGRLSLYGANAARLHDEIICVAARWVDPKVRKGELRPLGEEAGERAFELLQAALTQSDAAKVDDAVTGRLLNSIRRDVDELTSHLKARAEEAARIATSQLLKRGDKESAEMAEILAEQRKRIEKRELEIQQLELDFGEEEKRQVSADKKHWKRRVQEIAAELKNEPDRIRKSYVVQTHRVEPVGIVYLWPVSG